MNFKCVVCPKLMVKYLVEVSKVIIRQNLYLKENVT